MFASELWGFLKVMQPCKGSKPLQGLCNRAMKFETIHDQQKHVFLQCISGSKAYGLNTPTSDTDIRGVFILPYAEFYGLHYTDQVANPSNDIVYYELKPS